LSTQSAVKVLTAQGRAGLSGIPPTRTLQGRPHGASLCKEPVQIIKVCTQSAKGNKCSSSSSSSSSSTTRGCEARALALGLLHFHDAGIRRTVQRAAYHR
jgi:hypothetical protein